MKVIRVDNADVSIDATNRNCGECHMLLDIVRPVRCQAFGSILGYDEKAQDWKRSLPCKTHEVKS